MSRSSLYAADDCRYSFCICIFSIHIVTILKIMMLMTSTTSAREVRRGAARPGHAFPPNTQADENQEHMIAPIPLKSVNAQNEMPLEAEYKIIATRLP